MEESPLKTAAPDCLNRSQPVSSVVVKPAQAAAERSIVADQYRRREARSDRRRMVQIAGRLAQIAQIQSGTRQPPPLYVDRQHILRPPDPGLADFEPDPDACYSRIRPGFIADLNTEGSVVDECFAATAAVGLSGLASPPVGQKQLPSRHHRILGWAGVIWIFWAMVHLHPWTLQVLNKEQLFGDKEQMSPWVLPVLTEATNSFENKDNLTFVVAGYDSAGCGRAQKEGDSLELVLAVAGWFWYHEGFDTIRGVGPNYREGTSGTPTGD